MSSPDSTERPTFPAPTSEWSGRDSDGLNWKIEVEADCFGERDPMVVSIGVDDDDNGLEPNSALAMASPEQAREMAASLLFWAGYVEYRNNGGRP